MSDFTARVRAELDKGSISSIQSKIAKSLENTPIKLTNVSISNTAAFTKSIQSALSSMGLKIDGSKVDFGGVTKKAEQAAKSASAAMSSALSTLKIDGLEAKLTSAETGFNKLKNASSSLQANMQALQSAFQTLNNQNASNEERIAAAKRFNEILSVTNQQITAQSKAESAAASVAKAAAKERESAAKQVEEAAKKQAAAIKEAAQAEQTLTKSATLSNNMETWLNRNAKAAQVYGDQIRDLQSQLQGNKSAAVLTDVRNKFAEIKSAANVAGLSTNSFATSLKNVALQVTGLSSAAMVIRKIISEVKEAVNAVIELDTSLVDLKKTSSMSDNQLAQYYYDANDIAKELGRTTKEIIQTSADWSRLGFGSYEDATKMSKLAAQFASISPGMSIDDSTNTLVSVMKAFDVQTNDVLDGIMSKINIVGNNFALSNADLASGLMNSSSAMAVANNTLEETIALITAGTEITQNASKVGNGLRTGFCAYVQKCA